jgi:pantetheine-phosphate adenylyltransferase
MKRAVYAGSFDPVTNGHLWIIRQASQLFDEVIVSIGINPDKKYTFTLEERIEMLAKSIPHSNVRVDTFENDFLVRYADKINAKYIIRGIRSQIDFEYEKQMRNVNTEITERVETVFFIPPRDLADISSSFVKGLVGPEGWEVILRKYVPLGVFEKFAKKYSKIPFDFNQTYWTL